MSAVQEQQRLNFGVGRLFSKDSSGNILQYGQLQDISVDFKVEIKEAFSEGNYAFATADGHRSIDIQAKHYILDLPSLSNVLGGTAPATNLTGYALDEVVTVATHAYTLANTSGASVLNLTMNVTVGGVVVPTVYAIVASGSEVIGVSASVTAGVINFAVAETATTGLVSYSFTSAGIGSEFTVSSTYQNSAPTYTMQLLKRDRSRIDQSVGVLVFEFQAVRPMGIKGDFKEGDYTVYDRQFKAFANPSGNVLTVRAFNE